MKNKLTNTRVINSIGIGILAAITAGTPVLASISDSLSEENMPEPVNSSEIPAEAVNEAAETQNAGIIDSITQTQEVLQSAYDEFNMLQQEESENNPEVTEGVVETSAEETAPPAGEMGEGGETVDSSTQTEPEETPEEVETGDETQPTPDETQVGADGEQGSSTGEETENPPVTTPTETPEEGNGDAEPGNTETGNEPQDPAESETEPTDPTDTATSEIMEHLKNSKDALGNVKNDIADLDDANKKAEEAVNKFNAAVENPNNFIGSIVDMISDASSNVVGAVGLVTEEQNIAKDQAQAAVDAQSKVYASREEAAAAQQQAQEAAAAAQEAYDSAQKAVEEAANNKAIADQNLEELKRQLDVADAALLDMETKVQDAQEMLLEVLKSYGLDQEGEVNLDNLDGEAKVAYENAQQAVNLATQERDQARADYENAVAQVEAATNAYKDAEAGLDTAEKSMNEAVSDLKNKTDKWKDAQFQETLAKFNEGAIGTEKISLDYAKCEQALEDANDALAAAKEIKDKADRVLDNAQEAFDAAKKEETEAASKAAEAADEVLEAMKNNTDEVENAQKLAEIAEESAQAASEEVERALKCLGSAEKTAEEAQADLVKANQAVEDAEKAKNAAEEALKTAENELKLVRDSAIAEQIEAVRKAQEAFDAMKEPDGTAKYALAKELLVYQLLCEGKTVREIKAGDSSRKEIIVVDAEEKPTTYYFSYQSDTIEVFLKGTDVYISEAKFQESADAFEKEYDGNESTIVPGEKDMSELQKAIDVATQELSELQKAFNTAVQEKNRAEVVKVLVDMRDALDAVQTQSENLVQAEETYQNKNKDGDLLNTLSTALNNLINGGEKLDTAKSALSETEKAQTAVEETMKELANLSAQEGWDQEAYDNLKAAYDEAVADHAIAVEALKQCTAGLNSVKTEKERARIAANAVFDYISSGTVTPPTPTQPGTSGSTTPTQPGTSGSTTPTQPDTNGSTNTVQPVDPMQPVYGTIIDTITSPIIGDSGVSTDTNYTGYPGYTYTTWGGQTVYTADTPAASEGEPAEEELVNVEDEAVPLAEVGKDSKNKTNNTTTTKTTRKVSDEKVPLADIETEKNSKMSWWWILVIALLGATGTELYIRHKKKEEEEQQAKSAKQDMVKI